MASIMRFDRWQNSMGNGSISIESGKLHSPGSVVQFDSYKYPSVNDNYTSIADGVQYLTPITITFTPKFATSKLVVHSEAQCRFINAYGMYSGINRDGVGLNNAYTAGGLTFIYKGDQVNHHAQMVCHTTTTANSTSPTTFTVWVKPWSGSGEWAQGWGNNYIEVWEIAQ